MMPDKSNFKTNSEYFSVPFIKRRINQINSEKGPLPLYRADKYFRRDSII